MTHYSPAYLRMTEGQWQRTLVEAATLFGWTCHHTAYSIGTKSGYPDLEMFHPEYPVLWIEVKTLSGKVSQNQRDFMATINQSRGGRVYVIRPTEDDWQLFVKLITGQIEDGPGDDIQ